MKLPVVFLFVLIGSSLWAGGQSEAAGTDFSAAAAAEGRIVPPESIQIESYISQMDYLYPDPPGDLGISVYTGYDHFNISGQEDILHLGLQARRGDFEDLPGLNLAFVFDSSGSMSGEGKIDLVREAVSRLAVRLRDKDIISVVSYSDTPEVLLPAVRVGDTDNRKVLAETAAAVLPLGEADLLAGLSAGYAELAKNAHSRQVNRIILISDGGTAGDSGVITDYISRHKEKGFTLTAVGVGSDCDIPAMTKLAKSGGGSSRFMEDKEKAYHLFGADFSRMAVPVASNLQIEILFLEGVRLLDTWGYNHSSQGDRVVYTISNLHHRDYETILASIKIPPSGGPEKKRIAMVNVFYTDLSGRQRRLLPVFVEREYAYTDPAAGGYTSQAVAKSGTLLYIAGVLSKIGEVYYSCVPDQEAVGPYQAMVWADSRENNRTALDDIVSAAAAERTDAVHAKKQWCFDTAAAARERILDAHARLGEELFTAELGIFDAYVELLGNELFYNAEYIQTLLAEGDTN